MEINKIRRGLFYYFYWDLPSIPRPAADMEMMRVKKTFDNLFFDVKTYKNYSKNDFNRALDKLFLKDLKEYDMFCLAVVTNMRNKGELLVDDNEVLLSRNIVKKFVVNKHKDLIGKTKMFLFQAPETERHYMTDHLPENDKFPYHTFPVTEEIFIIDSSYKGAKEDKESPFWYLEMMCYLINIRGMSSIDFLTDVLIDLNARIKRDVLMNDFADSSRRRSPQNQRVPEITLTLTKKLVFYGKENLSRDEFYLKVDINTTETMPEAIDVDDVCLNVFNYEGFDRREGCEKDIENLKSVFKDFDMPVICEKNLPTENFKAKLDETMNGNKNPIVWTALMSHGEMNKMHLNDDEEFELSELNKYFCDEKINIVLAQMCRTDESPSIGEGDKSDHLQMNNPGTSKDIQESFPILKRDVIMFYSTYQGDPAVRDSRSGSWFIQELCQTLKSLEKHKFYELLDVFIETCNRVYKNHFKIRGQFRQMPVISTTLTGSVAIMRDKGDY